VPEAKKTKNAEAEGDYKTDKTIDKHTPKAGDSAAVAEWRARRATDVVPFVE